MKSFFFICISVLSLNASAEDFCPITHPQMEEFLLKVHALFSGKFLLGEEGTEEYYETLAVSGCENSLSARIVLPDGTEIERKDRFRLVDGRVQILRTENGLPRETLWADFHPETGDLWIRPTEPEKSSFIYRQCLSYLENTRCRLKWKDADGTEHAILFYERTPLKRGSER